MFGENVLCYTECIPRYLRVPFRRFQGSNGSTTLTLKSG